MSSTASPPTVERKRRPYHGSCHCGNVKYITYLTLPPAALPANVGWGPHATAAGENSAQGEHPRLRKCNCTTCHKLAIFHVRLPFAPDDFVLLSPLDPLGERGGKEEDGAAMGAYSCFDRFQKWLFCKTCGAHIFGFAGYGEVVKRTVPVWDTSAYAVDGVAVAGQRGTWAVDPSTGAPLTEERSVWVPKGRRGSNGEEEPWVEGNHRCYLTINAHSLESRQEGLDLRAWLEEERICYLDSLDETEENRYGKPHVGGTY